MGFLYSPSLEHDCDRPDVRRLRVTSIWECDACSMTWELDVAHGCKYWRPTAVRPGASSPTVALDALAGMLEGAAHTIRDAVVPVASSLFDREAAPA